VMLDREHKSVLSYARVAEDGTVMLVALNMSAKVQTTRLDLAPFRLAGARLVTWLSNPAPITGGAAGELTLPPYAAWLGAVHVPHAERKPAPGRVK
jgi:maltogenic amylase-like protein